MSVFAACMTLCVAAPAAAQDPGTGGASPGGAPASAVPAAPAGPVQQGAHVDAQVLATRVTFGAGRPAQLRYVAKGDRALSVSVDLVRMPDGLRIASWAPVDVAPGAETVVSWDGLAGGRVPRAGRYAFRVFVTIAGQTAQAAQADAPDATTAFSFASDVFPILGPHQFGDGAGRFGAGRSGYRHQGQDVFADCGTPLVAARGGTVRFAGSQSRAGNYIVIDADKTGRDHGYMHLRDPALFRTGDRVATGQLIGYVGKTGDATACHLHFELWTAPGWYAGGHPVDPLPSLQAWDGAAGARRR
jgi:murein DD-endopeptidase MepM/ murein hydrolase activator NlpD